MAKGVVATMSTLGYISEPSVKLDRAYAYWIANRESQNHVMGKVESLLKVIGDHQNDKNTTDMFVEAAQRSLTNHLLGFFDAAEVFCKAERITENGKCFNLIISATVVEDNVKYDLLKSVEVNGSTFNVIRKSRGLQ